MPKKKLIVSKKKLLEISKASDNKTQILFITFFGIGLLFVFLFLYFKFFSAKDPGHFLPKDKTLLFMNYYHDESLENLGIKKQNLEKFIETWYAVDFYNDLAPWFENRAAFALMNLDSSLKEVLFLEIKDRNKALDFLSGLGIENEEIEDYFYKRFRIHFYPYSRAYYFTFINKYVAISSQEQAIKTIIDTYNQNNDNLFADEKFQKVVNNLPSKESFFAYADLHGLKEQSLIVTHYGYLFDILTHAGVSIAGKDDHKNIKALTLINKDYFESNNYFENIMPFRGKLTSMIADDNVSFYAGGNNFSFQILQTLADLKKFNPAFSTIIGGILESQKKELFGEKVDIMNDIIPLLQNEYAFSISTDNDVKHITVIAEQKEKDLAESKMKKITKGFQKMMLYLVPKTVTRELPDGTIYSELVIDEEKIMNVDDEYKGIPIKGVELRETRNALFYAFVDNNLVVSTWLKGITNAIDAKEMDIKSFADNDAYRSLMKKVSLRGEEITYFKITSLIDLIPEKYAAFFEKESFQKAILSKKYFADGLSMELIIE